MDRLTTLENQSIYIIREAAHHYPKTALLWSIGKDSSTLLWLALKAFFGKLPFPVLHIDTSYKFKEMIEQRERLAKQLGLNLIVAQNKAALANGMNPEKEGRLACCTALKTNALQAAVRDNGFQALLLGIRRDEHGIRAKERIFSPRNFNFHWDYKHQPMEIWEQFKRPAEQDHHIRVHPLLEWGEKDIWAYVKREKIPMVSLYFAKEGKRFRSIGCERCCAAVESKASNLDEVIAELETTKTAERAGRAQDKESAYMMQKLRSLGYM
jgi:sulfate adenylyltransferase subunit 2